MKAITSFSSARAFILLVVSLSSICLPHLSFASSSHLKSSSSRSKNLRIQRPSSHKLPQSQSQPQMQSSPVDRIRKSRLSDTSDARFSSRRVNAVISTTSTSEDANNVDHWEKIGVDINGTEAGSQFGDSVAISKNGDVVAVGGRFHGSGTSANSGTVRIFRRSSHGNENSSRNDNKWSTVGNPIDGDETRDYSGKSISLSDDGSIVAIGSPRHDAQGKVRLYEYSATNDRPKWERIKMSETSESSDNMPRIGCFVTLSGDGKTLSFSGDKNDSNMKLVRTIRKDANNSWMEDTHNITIPGNASSTSSAEEDCPRISLSTDGSLLVVGDNGNDNSNTLKKGRVHVYERKELQGAVGWQPIDQTIEGEKGEMLGTSVSLSGDGLTLAAGGKDIVQIYRLAADDNMWKIFSTITYATTSLGSKENHSEENQKSNGTFGRSVSLSGDGTRIAVGDPKKVGMGAGAVHTFQLSEDGWSQLGSPIHGRTINGRFGFSVALSHDGESLIAGGPHRHRLQGTGYASVYDLYIEPSTSPSIMATINPSSSPGASLSSRPSQNATTGPSPAPSKDIGNLVIKPPLPPTSPPNESNKTVTVVVKASAGTIGGLTLSLFLLFVFNKRRRRQRNAHEYSPTKSRDLDLTSFPVTLPDSSSVVDTYKSSQSKTFDTFLSHNWGKDSHGRDNHERVMALSKALEQREISSWIDEEQMVGNIDDAIAKGIENSKTAIIFITGDYIAKVAGDGIHGSNDNCKKEFQHAMAHIRIANMIPVVMEEDLPAKWKGPVGLALGSSLYFTFKKDENLDACADILAGEIASRIREESEEDAVAKEGENQYSSGRNSSDEDSDENDDNLADQGQHTDTDPNAEEVDTNGSCRGSMCRESNSLMEESPLKAETSDTLVYRTNTIEKPPKVSFVRFEF
mmetsp:Transcript_17067/g.25707  ORF Transcript_17067/g.25707 Transcript_17067/m.25707 type:complete len:913 (-) Transcript_17067:126-2864(-)